MITQGQLKELLHYDPDTGVFTWRVRMSSRVGAGDVAGAKPSHGYISIKIAQRLYYAHRLAFLYMTGAWPDDTVDHENGVRSDNRWANLRDVAVMTNVQNLQRAHQHSRTGLLGVTLCRRDKRYVAQIQAERVRHSLGRFDTAEEAHAAYLKAKRELHEGCTI